MSLNFLVSSNILSNVWDDICFVKFRKPVTGKTHTQKSRNPDACTFAHQIPALQHCSVRLCTVFNTKKKN